MLWELLISYLRSKYAVKFTGLHLEIIDAVQVKLGGYFTKNNWNHTGFVTDGGVNNTSESKCVRNTVKNQLSRGIHVPKQIMRPHLISDYIDGSNAQNVTP